MFTIYFDKPFKNDDHFLHKHMHRVAFRSFKSESHKVFSSIERSNTSQSVLTSSSKVELHLQRLNKSEWIILNKRTTSFVKR